MIKGYGLVSSTVLRDPNVSLREKGLYAYLSTYADSNNTLNVSINRAASECDVDTSTIRRILDKLKKSGVIIRETRAAGQTHQTKIGRAHV